MAAAPRPGLCALKSPDAVRDEAEGSGLRRTVGTLDLTALGLGAYRIRSPSLRATAARSTSPLPSWCWPSPAC